jgi:hypothetical protein
MRCGPEPLAPSNRRAGRCTNPVTAFADQEDLTLLVTCRLTPTNPGGLYWTRPLAVTPGAAASSSSAPTHGLPRAACIQELPLRTTSNDNPVKASATETLKEPKGSKLDANRRAEYQSDVAAAETWDMSAWSRWTVTGRVLPERSGVWVAATISQGVGALGRFRLRLEVIRSHIAAKCALEKTNPSLFEIADVVRTALAFPIDYIAFQSRGAYEIVLDLCINDQTGEAFDVPNFDPIFEAKDASLCFDAHGDTTKLTIPYAAGAVPELPTALHDLTEAVRYPRRTFEYCRMAAEAVRRYFDPPNVRHHQERWRKGEETMCAALKLTRKSLQSLDAIAARSRHGELVVSIRWEMRKRALEFAWEVVARFIDHLQGGRSQDHWKLLDVRIED